MSAPDTLMLTISHQYGSGGSQIARGKVRRRVNERGRCNLRFAIKNLGRVNARTEGDTACDEEEHRDGRGVKPDLVDAGGVRAARHAATPATDVGSGGRRAARAGSL